MPNRRDEMLHAALEAFAATGFDGTSIADLAEATALSKAAFSYHFTGKDEILLELAEPLIAELEEVARVHPDPSWPDGVRRLLGDYLEALLRHRTVAVWVDGDKSVAAHPVIGERLERNNADMRRLIAGDDDPGGEAAVTASAVLGAIWRPIRNLTDLELEPHREALIDIALEGFRR